MHKSFYILLLGGLFIAIAIVYAIVFGNLYEEALVLFPMPWFQLTLVDLYLGFFLFGSWVFYRESSIGTAVLWLLLVCICGNVVSCIYAARALFQAKGDWLHFWTGGNATSADRTKTC